MTVKKRKGFFDDIAEIQEEPDTVEKSDESGASLTDKNECEAFGLQDERKEESSEATADATEFRKKNSKKRNTVVFSSIAVVLCAFVFISIAYSKGLFDGKYTEGTDGDIVIPKEEFYFYPADYETDIFTIPEYLALDRSIKYAPDSSQSYLLKNGDFASEGEPGLVVLGEYLNAVIAGDSEKVNSLFTEKYFEENERYEKFPPQKLFKIKIRNERALEENANGYTVYYFTVSYRIYKNDGLFRDNVDENRERAQIFEIFVYDDESGKINLIKDRPGYVLDI